MQLFLAKKGNAWLSVGSEAARCVMKGEIHEDIRILIDGEQMMAPLRLKELLKQNKMEEVSYDQIHILVVVPGIVNAIVVNESQDGYLTDELAYYQSLGQEIRNNCQEHCGRILDKIDTIYAETQSHRKPFICVEGSSGMGKSQLAFALGGEGREHQRPWFYWPLAPNEVDSQLVYKNFSSIAGAFNSVVKKDGVDDRKEEEAILSCDSSVYTTEKLWTHGFIIELLRCCSRANEGAQMIRVEKQTFNVTKSDRKAVDDVRSKMEKDGKALPFFILDELTPSGDNKKVSAFQLNVFRACGLVVVVMGTDAKLSNLASKSRHSRTNPHWWMTVVSSFPTYQSIPFEVGAKKEAWQKVLHLHLVVKHIAEHSRGLFSRYFVDAVVQFALGRNETFELADLLDAAFKAVYVKVQIAKDFMSTQEGRDAQLMALSYTNASREFPGIKRPVIDRDDTSERAWKRRKVDLNVGVESMHVHFANLVDEGITDVDVSHGSLSYRTACGVGDGWSPTCQFPTIETDVLLYLALLGGKKFSAYYNYTTEEAYSTVGVFRKWTGGTGNRTHGNSDTVNTDFIEFENLVAHALFCASRRNGVRGITFNHFIPALVGEFQDEFFRTKAIDISALLERYAGLKEKFAKTMTPFLAPPNAEWPNYILEAGGACNFGHLVRAQNSDRLDCYVTAPVDQAATNADPLFVCECKNWREKLDSGAMKKIIAGLNAGYTGRERKDGQQKPKWINWDLALVFCRELAQFEQKEIDGWKFPGTVIVTVNCKTWMVNGIVEPKAGEKLVIVLQTGNVLSNEVSAVAE